MRAALIAALAALIALPVQAQVSRLPRNQFDVIPPESRIAGERGDLKVIQPLCRVGPTHWARRRVVDIAVQEWAVFGYQTADARVVETRRLPDEVVAQAVNPLRVPSGSLTRSRPPWKSRAPASGNTSLKPRSNCSGGLKAV